MIVSIILGQAAAKKFSKKTLVYVDNDNEPDNESRELDLYLPTSATQPQGGYPLIIWFHGGGWQLGSRASIELAAVKQIERGYALASVSYSLSDKAQWPTQIHEAKAAVRWLRASAQNFGLNPQQFIAWGMSAGAHTACLLGTSAEQSELEGTMGSLDQSSAVQGVVGFYPPTDFLQMVNDGLIDHYAADSPTALFLGAPVREVPEKAASANPIQYVSSSSPATLLLHGDADPVVPLVQSELLFDALTQQGVKSQLNVYPGYTHGDFRFNTGARLKAIEDFLDGLF